MAPTIKNVALAGANGNLGSHILRALIDAGFNVTVLTRKAGTHTFPTGVTVKEVDYESLASLTEALRGQDAAISASSTNDPEVSKRLVDAAIAAGVYRFIPGDFGMDPQNPKVAALPVYGVKAVTYRHLLEKTKTNKDFTYTVVSNGAFLDFCIRLGFLGLDVKNKKSVLFNGGENEGPATTLSNVGKATAGVLLHPEETVNRPVYIQTVCKSQVQLAKLAEEALGGNWETTDRDLTTTFQECLESVKKGIYTAEVMYPQIHFAWSNKDYTHPWKQLDNELLGIKEMSDEEVKELIKSIAAE